MLNIPTLYTCWPHDGSAQAGKPKEAHTLIKVTDHCPMDGPPRRNEVFWLKNKKTGKVSRHFPWNLFLEFVGQLEGAVLEIFLDYWDNEFGLCPIFYKKVLLYESRRSCQTEQNSRFGKLLG